MAKLTGLKKQFQLSMLFEPSEFELAKFDCTSRRPYPIPNIFQNQNIGKFNNLNVFGSNKTKGHTRDRQSRLRSNTCMPERGEH